MDSRIFILILGRGVINATIIGGVVAVERSYVPAVDHVVSHSGAVGVACTYDSFALGVAAATHRVSK